MSETPNEQKCCQCIPISEEASKGLHQMINVGLFRDPIFVMFVISNFFTSIGFNVPYVYTVVSTYFLFELGAQSFLTLK